jgi:hypothetical protein
MKSLLLSVCLLLSLGASAQSAKPASKDNTVLIQTPDSASTALRKLAAAFTQRGYTVSKLDTEFLTLTLEPKLVAHKTSPTLAVRAIASPGAFATLRMAGEYQVVIFNQPLREAVYFSGNNNSCNAACFRELQRAAAAYPQGKVTYAKR